MPDYYKAWDKFDLDKELESETITYQPPEPPKTQQDMLRPTSGAQPNTRIVIKGGTRVSHADAEHLKSQGNSYFQSLDF